MLMKYFYYSNSRLPDFKQATKNKDVFCYF